ncbi:MAG TPA: AtpZ/AtpI family protein [Deltaproteobacteria bacterium]|nr:AtpZ/AtpI family protein [Deltaproteobacteria bacterium]
MGGRRREGRTGGLLKGLAAVAALGVTLVASTFTGLAIGYYLDGLLGTGPWLTIILLLAGIAAGFRNVYHVSKKLDL